MLKFITGILLIFLALPFKIDAHPVHVSVCNLEFGKDEVLISVKLFRDDLQLALEHEKGIKADLNSIDNQREEEIICNYIKEKLKVMTKEQELLFDYTGKEIKEMAVWMNFRIPEPGKLKKLKLVNSLLVDTFHDQTNLLIISYTGKQNGYRFTYNERVIETELKGLTEYK